MEQVLQSARQFDFSVGTNRDQLYMLSKRFLDIAIVSSAMIVLAPLLAVIAILVKSDGGPIIYRQPRVGKDGRIFTFFKFRSMVPDADKIRKGLEAKNEMASGVTFKMERDPRITPVGRFLRRYSLDELPQLWNVLIGDMSIVGPRPALVDEVAKYTPEQMARLSVDQGLTCLWQVGGRSLLDFDRQVALDLDYIHSASLWTDLSLMFRTVPAVLGGKGAY